MTSLNQLSNVYLICGGLALLGCGGEQPAGGNAGHAGAPVTGDTAAGNGGAIGSGGSNALGGGPSIPSGEAGQSSGGPKGGSGGGVGAGVGGSVGASGAGMTGGSANAMGAAGAGPTSSGCGSTNVTSPCGTKGTTCTLNVSGTDRKYYVQLPKNYDASTPYRLIFQYHPWGGSADQALTMYGLNSGLPDSIFVTPQGLDAGGNGPGWANTDGVDIAFTKAMLADVKGKYCIDSSRIFSVGFSYGGMMSFALGCEMSDTFRAIAPMSGSLYSDFNCKGTGPHVAMWGSHGTNDTVVPIDDGRAARDKILKENHCGTTTTPVDPSPCVKYEGCDAGYDVTWCEWDGPHGIPSFGSKSITAFFKQF
ncbi:MAG TPA: Ricin and poly(3-hydroxybutyrate) depolymerase fusion [Polyangiaceae bacterium]|nr:Ricin and poly(3-hydroxybutyrate) depolymerase fusion [Polyangiaceae bacterium]